MKLRLINEIGHWDLAPGHYPNSLIKTKKNKPKRHSPLLDPDDRERFLRWSKPTNEDHMKLRMLREYKLTNKGDWGPEKPDLGSRHALKMQPGNLPQSRFNLEPEEDVELVEGPEEGTIPVRLSYAVYKIFQRYWEGQSDPLYAILSRRGDSVDWVTVYASPDEIDRLASVAEFILMNSDDPAETRTAQSLKEVLEDI